MSLLVPTLTCRHCGKAFPLGFMDTMPNYSQYTRFVCTHCGYGNKPEKYGLLGIRFVGIFVTAASYLWLMQPKFGINGFVGVAIGIAILVVVFRLLYGAWTLSRPKMK